MYRIRFLTAAFSIVIVVAFLRCGSDDGTGPGTRKLVIVPDSVVVETSSSQVFEAEMNGSSPRVMWFVDAERGGLPASGMIDSLGLYIAPHAVPDDSVVTVKAVDVDDPEISATARVLIRGGQATPWISVTPSDTTLSPGESVVFAEQVGGCPTSDVDWSVKALWEGAGEVGAVGTDGSYTLPATLTGDAPLLVTAAGLDCSGRRGIAKVTVAVPEAFLVELEDYTDWHDEEAGEHLIRPQYCSQASGHYSVKDMDYPGEWIEVPISVPASATYELILRYAASVGDTLRGTISFPNSSGALTETEIDFVMDQGAGLG